jgi:hypothetical protein
VNSAAALAAWSHHVKELSAKYFGKIHGGKTTYGSIFAFQNPLSLELVEAADRLQPQTAAARS